MTELCDIFQPFVKPPPTNTYHIIWNLLLCDKTMKLTQDIIEQEKVGHILAILPDKEKFLELNNDIPNVSYDVLEYFDKHEPVLDTELFSKVASIIDIKAKEQNNRNVLVFCNSGYQRSVPFLVYYLTKYHSDEVPSVEKAVELILSQLDKKAFLESKNEIIHNIKSLFV